LSLYLFRDEESFQKEYGNLNSAADVEKLQALLKPLMLRRLKEDVEKTIPVKEETIVEVELTTIQKKWYRSILERNFSWLKQGTKRNNMPNLINTMIELRKCCIHPFLLKGTPYIVHGLGAEEAIYDEYKAGTPEQHFQVMIQASGKMVLIDKLLRKLHAGGHKVLLFSQMTKCLDIIQDYLKGRGYGYERIDGSIRGDLRQAAIDRFCDKNSESFSKFFPS
jgi:SNF2 family DNA or RNA helicase